MTSDRAIGVLLILLALTSVAFTTSGTALTAFLFFGCLAIVMVVLLRRRK